MAQQKIKQGKINQDHLQNITILQLHNKSQVICDDKLS